MDRKMPLSRSGRPILKLCMALVVTVAFVMAFPVASRAQCGEPNGGPVHVKVFSGFVASGGGTPYSGFVGACDVPNVMFASSTGYSWHPFSLTDFGADITGTLKVASSGTYTFTLNSDDGSQLYIDGSLVVDDGGTHPPNIASGTAVLTAGFHSFEVQFFECCGDPAGVDLTLPTGVTYAFTSDVFVVDYFANANTAGAQDATVRVINPGTGSNTANTEGLDLCALIYVFDANQQLSECCGCFISANALLTLSVNKNLTNNPLLGTLLKTGVIKIIGSHSIKPCDPTAINPEPTLRAWATHIQNKVGTAFPPTEGESQAATLGLGEANDLGEDCTVLKELGSGAGVCNCPPGH
jgi:hypothetical protein